MADPIAIKESTEAISQAAPTTVDYLAVILTWPVAIVFLAANGPGG